MPSLKRLVAILWLPGLIYLAFAIARLNGIQGETDLVGISAVMRIVFLSFGASIGYILIIAAQWDPFRAKLKTALWHNLAGWFIAMIVDDAFMVHEQIGFHLQIKDTIPMLMLGVWLLIILGIYRERFVRDFWKFFAGFVILSWIAIFGDVATGREGTIMIQSFEFDYEMFCELLAVAFLAAGFAIQASFELQQAALPADHTNDRPGNGPR
jgi:hypothetical protein